MTHLLSWRTWPPSERNVLSRQILFTAINAVPFVALVAVTVGVSVVMQLEVWLGKAGQSTLLGPILVAVVIREIGPLMTNFVVIGRSGAAIAAELAAMKVNDELKVMEAQGIDPFTYLVVPRVLGVMVAVFLLSIIFIGVCFVSGLIMGMLLNITSAPPSLFFDRVMGAVRPSDVINLLAKTLIPGALTGAICCVEGLRVRGAITEVPRATTRAIVGSVGALFVTSAIVSVLTYL